MQFADLVDDFLALKLCGISFEKGKLYIYICLYIHITSYYKMVINPYKSTILNGRPFSFHGFTWLHPASQGARARQMGHVPPASWSFLAQPKQVLWWHLGGIQKKNLFVSVFATVSLYIGYMSVCLECNVMPCNAMQCACMHACMHVCMYACMHVCMLHACLPVCLSGCMDGWMCIYIYVLYYHICANKCLHFNHTLEYFYISITLP